MKRLVRFLLLNIIIPVSLLLAAGQPVSADPPVVEKVLSANEELTAPVDCQAFRHIKIRLENLVDMESVCWWTSFHKGKERSESEIGPRFIRTIALLGKVKDASEGIGIRADRQTIELVCSKTDEVLVHVDKGKVLVKITQGDR